MNYGPAPSQHGPQWGPPPALDPMAPLRSTAWTAIAAGALAIPAGLFSRSFLGIVQVVLALPCAAVLVGAGAMLLKRSPTGRTLCLVGAPMLLVISALGIAGTIAGGRAESLPWLALPVATTALATTVLVLALRKSVSAALQQGSPHGQPWSPGGPMSMNQAPGTPPGPMPMNAAPGTPPWPQQAPGQGWQQQQPGPGWNRPG